MDTLPPQMLRRWLIHLLAWIAGITLLLSPLAPQAGEKWPAKEIHLVVPWPAGGPSDVMARILAKELSAGMGQPVVVENRAGATGTIGARHVARSKADGYTLLFGNTVALVGAVVSSPEPVQFDPVRDFAPIALLAETVYILTAHPSAGVRNYPEFIARARDPAKPPVAVGSTGNGATSDILYDWLTHHQQANLTKIAFKGTAPLVADLIAGHLPVGSAGLSLAQPYYKEGKLHPLVIGEAQAVALANGLPPGPTPEERLARTAQVAASGHFRTSMLQDRAAGKSLELEPIIGAVLELARRRALSTPTLKRLYAEARQLTT